MNVTILLELVIKFYFHFHLIIWEYAEGCKVTFWVICSACNIFHLMLTYRRNLSCLQGWGCCLDFLAVAYWYWGCWNSNVNLLNYLHVHLWQFTLFFPPHDMFCYNNPVVVLNKVDFLLIVEIEFSSCPINCQLFLCVSMMLTGFLGFTHAWLNSHLRIKTPKSSLGITIVRWQVE